MVEIPEDQIWMIVVGFIIAFILAFGIGANDVANSFGTSVGAKVLTLRQACIFASIFETLGAVLIGTKVSDTIRKGIIGIEPYQNHTELLMVGNVAALTGSMVWLVGATLLRLPVSATHSIVGATIGFALVAHGSKGINWVKLGMIIGSWFASPVLAGVVSTALFYLCKYFILSKEDPLEPGLRFLPIFYAGTITINLFSVFYDGPEMLYLHEIPLWGTFIIAFGAGILTAIIVRFVIVPWQRRKITAECAYNAVTVEQQDVERKLSYSAPKPYAEGENGDVPEKIALNPADPAAIELELRENEKNLSCLHHHGASNILPPNISSGILTEITKDQESGANNKPAPTSPVKKPDEDEPVVAVTNNNKINKDEDAPLVDNEYRLGTCTPTKSRTPEEVSRRSSVTILSPDSKVPLGGAAVVTIPNGTSANLASVRNELENEMELGRSTVVDRPETARLFSFLQILTAIFGSFAHGGNDVSNAIGPLVSLWLIGTTGLVSAKAVTPIWILFYGGAGISIGLWVWGRRVIKTIGEDLTKITPSSGFCIEIGSALTVLVASNIGIPISTTHCKVGSVVFVGRFRSQSNVDWKIFRNIVLAWLVTLPITGGISAAIMVGLRLLVPH